MYLDFSLKSREAHRVHGKPITTLNTMPTTHRTVDDYEYAYMSTMTGTEKCGSNPRSITSFFFAEYNFVFQIDNK